MMTTRFDSFDESKVGGFEESPLGARNKPRGPIWLAANKDDGHTPAKIWEIEPESLKPIRWGWAPTHCPTGIGGDDEVIWYSDFKTDPGRQIFKLSPYGWGDDDHRAIPVLNLRAYALNRQPWSVGGDEHSVYAYFVDPGQPDQQRRERVMKVDSESLEIIQESLDGTGLPGRGSPVKQPSAVGGSRDVCYVTGAQWERPHGHMIVTLEPRTFSVHSQGLMMRTAENAHWFSGLGGAVDVIWALDHYGLIYENLYEIRRSFRRYEDGVWKEEYTVVNTKHWDRLPDDDWKAWTLGGA
jgi:hypothetical protein